MKFSIFPKCLLLCLIVLCTSTYMFYMEVLEPTDTDNASSLAWLSEELEYIERQERLVKMCKLLNNESTFNNNVYDVEALMSQNELLEHIVVDSKHKLLYCYVPKVACTNWKRIMMVLLGMVETEKMDAIPSDYVHRPHLMPLLINFTMPEIEDILRSHKKFLFVRHPFERLLSAYKNKFEQTYNSSKYFQTRFGRLIIKNFRVNPSNKSLLMGDDVTFNEFLRFVISENTIFNEHWKPIFDLCQPCLVKYDFIGKYESLYRDSDFLLNHLGVSNISFPRVQKSKRTSTYLGKYLPELPYKTLTQLYKVYYNDFKVFDYNVRDYLGYEID